MHWYNLIHKKAYNPVTLSERASMKNGEEGYNSCRVMGAPDSIWEFAIDLECLVNFIIQIYERLYLNSLTNDNFIFTKKKMIILQMISHGFIGAALFFLHRTSGVHKKKGVIDKDADRVPGILLPGGLLQWSFEVTIAVPRTIRETIRV